MGVDASLVSDQPHTAWLHARFVHRARALVVDCSDDRLKLVIAKVIAPSLLVWSKLGRNCLELRLPGGSF